MLESVKSFWPKLLAQPQFHIAQRAQLTGDCGPDEEPYNLWADAYAWTGESGKSECVWSEERLQRFKDAHDAGGNEEERFHRKTNGFGCVWKCVCVDLYLWISGKIACKSCVVEWISHSDYHRFYTLQLLCGRKQWRDWFGQFAIAHMRCVFQTFPATMYIVANCIV